MRVGGGKAEQLRAPSSVPNTHFWWLTNAYNSSLGDLAPSSDLGRHLHSCAHTPTHTQIHIIKNKTKYLIRFFSYVHPTRLYVSLSHVTMSKHSQLLVHCKFVPAPKPSQTGTLHPAGYKVTTFCSLLPTIHGSFSR